MIENNKDALPTIHHKDLKQLSNMIDNVVYLYDKGWTKEELKSYIDKYCLESVDKTLTMIKENTKSKSVKNLDSIINSYRP